MEQKITQVDIYETKKGDESKVGAHHLATTVLLIIVSIITWNYGVVDIPFLEYFGFNSLIFIIMVNIISAVYFSGWGIAASVIGNIVALYIADYPLIENIIWAGDVFLVTLIFAATYRLFKIDPRVDKRYAYLFLLLLVSTLSGTYVFLAYKGLNLYPGTEANSGILEFANFLSMGILTYFVMGFISPLIVESKYFVKKWFAQ